MNAPIVSITLFLSDDRSTLSLKPRFSATGKSEGVVLAFSKGDAEPTNFKYLSNEEAWAIVDALKMVARA